MFPKQLHANTDTPIHQSYTSCVRQTCFTFCAITFFLFHCFWMEIIPLSLTKLQNKMQMIITTIPGTFVFLFIHWQGKAWNRFVVSHGRGSLTGLWQLTHLLETINTLDQHILSMHTAIKYPKHCRQFLTKICIPPNNSTQGLHFMAIHY